jgi:hypothetical protein
MTEALHGGSYLESHGFHSNLWMKDDLIGPREYVRHNFACNTQIDVHGS